MTDGLSVSREASTYNRHAYQSDQSPCEVKSVWSYPIDFPTPKDGKHDEDAAIGSVNTPQMGRLQGRNCPIENQDHSPGKPVSYWFCFPQPKPDQIAATDFTKYLSQNNIYISC